MNDFGFVSLDVLSAYPEDSGVYTVRATNRNGEATSQLNITVQRESWTAGRHGSRSSWRWEELEVELVSPLRRFLQCKWVR